MTSSQDRSRAAAPRLRRRSRGSSGRVRSVRFGLTEEEYREVRAAAEHAGMAKGAYAACATLAAARGMVNPAQSPFRQALTELIRAATLVRRIGVNLNQAVAKLNAPGSGRPTCSRTRWRARGARNAWTRRRKPCGGTCGDRQGAPRRTARGTDLLPLRSGPP